MDKLIIKVALNEWVPKDVNPHVPYGPREVADDILACAAEGASVFHFHGRDPETGEQRRSDPAIYAEAMRLVAESSDAIVCPGYQGLPIERRFDHWEALAADESVTLEMGPLDVGAFNLTTYEELRAGRPPQLETFHNSHADMIHCLRLIGRLGMVCTLGLREPGHLRQVLAYHEMGLVKAPLLLKFYFTDRHPYGLPPTAQGLEMYLSMVPPEVPHLWFIEAKGGAYLPMESLAVSRGGHVRIGIGDCPVLDGEPLSNAEQVRRFAALARQAGRDVATPSEARAMMGIPPSG